MQDIRFMVRQTDSNCLLQCYISPVQMQHKSFRLLLFNTCVMLGQWTHLTNTIQEIIFPFMHYVFYVFYLFVLNNPCKWTSSEYQLSIIHITRIFNTLSQQVSAIRVAWFCFKAKTSHILEVLAQHSWNDRSGINKSWLRPPVRTNSIHKTLGETSQTLCHYSVSSYLQSHNKHHVKEYCILLHITFTRHHLLSLFTSQCLWANKHYDKKNINRSIWIYFHFSLVYKYYSLYLGSTAFIRWMFFIWIHVSWVNEQCSVTALITLHWTVRETDYTGLTWNKWRENGNGIIPEFYQKSWGKPHWSYLASQLRIKLGTSTLQVKSTTDWAGWLVSFTCVKNQS